MNAALIAQAGAADERRHKVSAELERISDGYYSALAKAQPDELDDFLEALSSPKDAALRAARNKFLSLALTGSLYDSAACRAAVDAFRALVHKVSDEWAADVLEAQRVEQEQDAAEARHQNTLDEERYWLGVGA